MIYRRFGRTEIQMPVFSCGGMRYQQDWKDKPEEEITEESRKNMEATIHHAMELGINHFETARGYGTSEMQLGRVLPGLDREKITIQTKVAPFEKSEKFLRAWEKSIGYLKLDYVDLLSMHGVNNAELLRWCLRPGGCLEEAKKLREKGLVRHIGFSTHAPIEVILEAIETGEFDYINLHWYYIFQNNWPAVEAARRHDMGVFIISPSDKGGHLYSPSEKLVELCRPLSPIVFNDLFCLARAPVHTLSIGAARPTDFDEHVKTLEHLENGEEILPPIIDRLERAMIEAHGKQWLETWDKGLPEWSEIPGKVNIRSILWLRNLALAFDLMEYGKARYGMLGNASHWFPGEKADKVADLDLAECLASSPHADRIPALLAESHELFGAAETQRLSSA